MINDLRAARGCKSSSLAAEETNISKKRRMRKKSSTKSTLRAGRNPQPPSPPKRVFAREICSKKPLAGAQNKLEHLAGEEEEREEKKGIRKQNTHRMVLTIPAYCIIIALLPPLVVGYANAYANTNGGAHSSSSSGSNNQPLGKCLLGRGREKRRKNKNKLRRRERMRMRRRRVEVRADEPIKCYDRARSKSWPNSGRDFQYEWQLLSWLGLSC